VDQTGEIDQTGEVDQTGSRQILSQRWVGEETGYGDLAFGWAFDERDPVSRTIVTDGNLIEDLFDQCRPHRSAWVAGFLEPEFLKPRFFKPRQTG
jgi:hypothetical protein